MADDLDVEAMLEAPYKKEDDVKAQNGEAEHSEIKKKKKKRSRSRERDTHRDRDRDRGSDRRDRDRDRDADRSRNRGGGDRHGRGRDSFRGGRRRSRSPRRRGGDHDRFRGRDSGRHGRSDSKSPGRGGKGDNLPGSFKRRDGPELTPEERDQRTVFCMQLAGRCRERDLEEFFSSVGQVRDVRLIVDNKTRRSKGIAYIEFVDPESVPLAMGLNGQKLLGVPIIIQPSQAEKNRAAQSTTQGVAQRGNVGPMKLYVGSLHFNITEDMLKGIFEPFGKIDHIQLMMDSETGRSRGYGFVTFHNAEDAKKAMEQLNGFELAGRPMKVGHVTERSDASSAASFLDSDELDRTGIDLGTTGRLQLMAKLAEGTGLQIPVAAANALNMNPLGGIATLPGAAPLNFGNLLHPQPPQQQQQQQQVQAAAPAIATPCFMLSNMFDPAVESTSGPNWDAEIRQDIVDECNKHGGIVHVFVDKGSPQGNVYVKCPTIQSAANSVNSLHGRWFGGKMVTAAYVPLLNYHNLFPDSMTSTQMMMR